MAEVQMEQAVFGVIYLDTRIWDESKARKGQNFELPGKISSMIF